MTDEEFAAHLERYMANKREEMREKFNRVLPSGEYIFNRFDKAVYLKCGKGSSVYDTSVIMGDVEIGENVWVGPYTLLEGSNAKLTIGNNVSIGAGVMIYTHDSTKRYASGKDIAMDTGDVTIGDHVSINTMSTISCNVTIGNHCVIGANSLVNRDVPDYSIFAGTPAKKIGEVVIHDDDSVEFLYY